MYLRMNWLKKNEAKEKYLPIKSHWQLVAIYLTSKATVIFSVLVVNNAFTEAC